jgi:hypothetical protein
MTTNDANSEHDGEGDLEDGCSPSTPENDSLQRQYVLAQSSRMEAEARAMGGEVVRTDHLVFGARGFPHPIFNQCVLLQPVASIDPEVFADELAACRALGSPLSIWSMWPTGDLRHLRLTLSGHPPLMARLPGPRPLSATSEPDGLDVAEVADDEDLRVFGRVAAAGFGMGDGADDTPSPFDRRMLDTGWRGWLARLDGEPVATAAGRTAHGVNLVEIVATLERARGRGIGAAVTWAATLADPTLPAVLVASDLGRPVYTRMGYFTLSRGTVWLDLAN